MQIGNAGQIRPLRVAAAGGVEIMGGQDPPLGLHLNCPYSEFSCTLDPGDSLFLYSSSVVDACSATGESFGLARLEQALNACLCAKVHKGYKRLPTPFANLRVVLGPAIGMLS